MEDARAEPFRSMIGAAREVDRLRRRAPGGRHIIYLDQCVLSRLARDAAAKPLLDVLRAGVASGQLVCPASQAHLDEAMLAPESYGRLLDVLDELSLGVRFHHDEDYLLFSEILAAAAEFLDRPPWTPVWREAFETDPHAELGALLPGGFRIAVRFSQAEWMQAEVAHEKRGVAGLARCFELAQQSGRTFEQQAELEYAAMLEWKLALLLDDGGAKAALAQSILPLLAEWIADSELLAPGGALSRSLARTKRRPHVESLLRRYPEIASRREEFAGSEALRSVPALRLPALLMAGLVVTRGRKPKRGDHHDIIHLTRGLSRCDVVTSDSGMAAMCRERGLIPAGCRLFSSRELEQLRCHIEDLIN